MNGGELLDALPPHSVVLDNKWRSELDRDAYQKLPMYGEYRWYRTGEFAPTSNTLLINRGFDVLYQPGREEAE